MVILNGLGTALIFIKMDSIFYFKRAESRFKRAGNIPVRIGFREWNNEALYYARCHLLEEKIRGAAITDSVIAQTLKRKGL